MSADLGSAWWLDGEGSVFPVTVLRRSVWPGHFTVSLEVDAHGTTITRVVPRSSLASPYNIDVPWTPSEERTAP